MKTFEGKLVSKGIKVGIVAARFNEFITAKLLGGAMDALLRHDVEEKNIHVAWVATVYKGNIIKNLIMDCQSYTKYRPNETTGGIFVSWRRKEELPTGA